MFATPSAGPSSTMPLHGQGSHMFAASSAGRRLAKPSIGGECICLRRVPQATEALERTISTNAAGGQGLSEQSKHMHFPPKTT
jgi:hypothetical protein